MGLKWTLDNTKRNTACTYNPTFAVSKRVHDVRVCIMISEINVYTLNVSRGKKTNLSAAPTELRGNDVFTKA